MSDIDSVECADSPFQPILGQRIRIFGIRRPFARNPDPYRATYEQERDKYRRDEFETVRAGQGRSFGDETVPVGCLEEGSGRHGWRQVVNVSTMTPSTVRC